MDAKVIPGYTLKKKLGSGAMAVVFLAREEKLQRDVALKVMSKKLLSDPSFADRFLREARIVASISHRNIVTVFDVGSYSDYHYMAMELLPGGDLTSRLKQSLALEAAIGFVKDIAEGLQYAGSKNLIHRDIKPDNIMFAEDGRAVITDFGIARDASSENNMTMAGTVIGTPQYMSPEQAGAKTLDHRTDLYSLGIILYQILAGRPPFKGDSAISTGVMHITQPVPALPARYGQFQNFIDIALAKNPDERFQSGREFIEALSLISLEGREEDLTETLLFSAEDISKSVNSKRSYRDEPEDLLADLSDEFLAPSAPQLSSTELPARKSPALVTKSNTSSSSIIPGLTLADVESNSVDTTTYIPSEKNSSEFSITFPKKIVAFLLLFIGIVGWHIYYVNVLSKPIPFFVLSTKIAGFSQKQFGYKLNLNGTVKVLSSASNGFGRLTENALGKLLPDKSTALVGLSAKEKQLVGLLESAIAGERLYSPPFDCAELYLRELRIINPNSELVKSETSSLLKLSFEKSLKLIEAKKFEQAEALLNESTRLLSHSDDKQLHLKHRQLMSTLIIQR